MADLTDEDKKILERMKRQLKEHPLKPIVTPNPDKFNDGSLVPADQYKDWHEVIDKGERRAPKQQRRKRPPAK
jgi:hypothetical protein